MWLAGSIPPPSTSAAAHPSRNRRRPAAPSRRRSLSARDPLHLALSYVGGDLADDQLRPGRAVRAHHRLLPDAVVEQPLGDHRPMVARMPELQVEEPVLVRREVRAPAPNV